MVKITSRLLKIHLPYLYVRLKEFLGGGVGGGVGMMCWTVSFTWLTTNQPPNPLST